MKYLKALGFAAAALCTVPAAWSAEWAHTAKDVNLRAGPSVDYPVVARLAAGVQISVEGCLSDYRWCDVVAGPHRGWVYAGNIVYPYQGANVPVLNYGSLIGIGIAAFILGNYWDDHYRDRPWYPQRQYWIDRPGPRPGWGPAGPRPPAPAYGPGYAPRPPAPGFVGPGSHPRPPGVRPGSGTRPPQGAGPGGSGQPPQGAGPGGMVRPPQGAGPSGSGRPPQGAGPEGAGRRAPQGAGPGGNERPPRGAGPDGGGRRAPQGGRDPAGADRP